jgi:hypothetical protein
MDLQILQRDASYAGWVRTVLAWLLWRLQIWSGIQVFRVNLRPIPADAPPPAPPDGIRLCLLRLDQLLEAAADPELDLGPDFIRDALARGDIAFGAYEGERLVGCSWRTATAAPLAESLWTRIGPRCHHVYKTFVRPSHRGRHIHVAMTRFADRISVERGCPAEIGFVNICNLASLGAAKRLGRPRVGYAGYIVLFGHCIPFRTRGLKKLGIVVFKPHTQESVRLVPAQG